MFQHASPWKFNPLNRGCIYCVSLSLPEHFQPCWSPSRHQNTAGIAQMPARLLPGTSFGQRNSFGNSESGWGFLLSVLSIPFSLPLPFLLKGWDLPKLSWSLANSCVLLPNEQETPPAPHPASQHPKSHGNEVSLRELSCPSPSQRPWVLLHWGRTRSLCRPCSWDGGDAEFWDITAWRGL